jgi:hypothetical protein
MQLELDAARDTYYVIRELVVHHPGGANERSLATVRKLCRAAACAIHDRECDEALSAVEQHAAQYFTRACSDWTRRQLLRELEWFRARLYAVEAIWPPPRGA